MSRICAVVHKIVVHFFQFGILFMSNIPLVHNPFSLRFYGFIPSVDDKWVRIKCVRNIDGNVHTFFLGEFWNESRWYSFILNSNSTKINNAKDHKTINWNDLFEIERKKRSTFLVVFIFRTKLFYYIEIRRYKEYILLCVSTSLVLSLSQELW